MSGRDGSWVGVGIDEDRGGMHWHKLNLCGCVASLGICGRLDCMATFACRLDLNEATINDPAGVGCYAVEC